MGSKKHIMVGDVKIGGAAPVTIQSMTNTKTDNIQETAKQINMLSDLGCDIIRVAVPDFSAADAIYELKKQINIPLIADIHFNYKLAIRAAQQGADKLRINPSNIGTAENVGEIASICNDKGVPIRVGVNSGSISKQLLEKHGGVTAQAMYESAMESVELLNYFDFDDICISVKASSVALTIEAYRLISQETDYPLHLGVTEAGTEYMGLVKSSIGIGSLLADGIGDTLRVSLTAPVENEVAAGLAILKALNLRQGYELISCPTCGRCKIDLVSIAHEVEGRLLALDRDITVAVMGCAVNGPGEASRADYGIAGGDGAGVIFAKGEVVKTVPMENLVEELFSIIEKD
ncbi:MAG: flavodoxin-dependent (E)-4-hydroxy-3-methylbut-2-enyl-diphosphate synthase [Oscillospiraceae bacterium]|nr:flavodoxin-dependent (E)-4-hydroxy-3-methylbut-2-enyl-diphosphate synthase [Oscillospiraceae bacterium]